eukprot:2768744-Prymnesium_polylepis.1
MAPFLSVKYTINAGGQLLVGTPQGPKRLKCQMRGTDAVLAYSSLYVKRAFRSARGRGGGASPHARTRVLIRALFLQNTRPTQGAAACLPRGGAEGGSSLSATVADSAPVLTLKGPRVEHLEHLECGMLPSVLSSTRTSCQPRRRRAR